MTQKDKLAECQSSCDRCFLRAYKCPGFEALPAWFRVLLACLLNFFTGGVIYGWSALQEVYKAENVSVELCSNDTTTFPCSEQLFQLGLVFSAASTGNMCAGLPMGVLVDLAGPRIAFLISEIFVFVGAILLGFASDTFDVYVPAFLIMGIGGAGVQVSLMHTSNLFPRNKSNVTNAIHACFQLSFLIFALFQLLYNLDPVKYTSDNMFLVYSAIVFMCLIAGVFWPGRAYGPSHGEGHSGGNTQKGPSPSIILPPGGFQTKSARHSVVKTIGTETRTDSTALLESAKQIHDIDAEDGSRPSSDEIPFDENDYVVVTTAGVMTNKTITENQRRLVSKSMSIQGGQALAKGEVDPITATFKEQIFAGHLWACVFFVTIGIVFSNSFIATIGQNLGAKAAQSNISAAEIGPTVSTYASIFTILNSVAVIFLPLLGLVMDRLGTASGALTVAILNLLYAASALLPGIQIQVMTFVLYAIGRTFTFSYVFAYVNIEFGLKYFGLLCGIIMFFTGLMNLLLNVIDALISDGTLTITEVQYMQLGVYAASFYFPIFLFAKKGCKLGCKRGADYSRDSSSSVHLDNDMHIKDQTREVTAREETASGAEDDQQAIL